MKRSLSLVVGIAVGAVLIAAIGASANIGGTTLTSLIGVHHSQLGDKASGARTESPEPTKSPRSGARLTDAEAEGNAYARAGRNAGDITFVGNFRRERGAELLEQRRAPRPGSDRVDGQARDREEHPLATTRQTFEVHTTGGRLQRVAARRFVPASRVGALLQGFGTRDRGSQDCS